VNEKKSDGGTLYHPWTMPSKKKSTMVMVELKGRKVSCDELIWLVFESPHKH